MNTNSQQHPAAVAGDRGLVVPSRIGLLWGLFSWLPIFLLLLGLAATAYRGGSGDGRPFATTAFLATLALSLPVLLFAGRWWATRGLSARGWAFVLTAIAHGLALLASFFFALLLAIWLDGANLFKEWKSSDFGSAFVAWGMCTIWTLALGVVVAWRVRRAVARATDTAAENAGVSSSDETRPEQGVGSRRVAIELALSVAIPLLLCVPVVLMLHYDASLHRRANSILTTQIKMIGAQLVDLKDLEKVKSQLLARQQIVQTLEAYTARAADVLGILGRWPNGVQLLSLEMKESQVAFAVRCVEPARELAVVELLAQSGYRDLRIVSRQRDSGGVAESVTIDAVSTRGEKR